MANDRHPDKNTIRLSASPRGLRAAAAFLARGGTVAFPTETVYGLGADARHDAAVAGIFAAKERPSFNPLILHIKAAEEAARYAEWPEAAARLAAAFWPGPLTLILPRRPDAGISRLASAGRETVALRMPDHPLAQALLAEAGAPLAAPSANPSGRISPTHADHVMDGLSGRIDAVLDGGACPVGVESAIVDLTGHRAVLARPGGLPQERIAEILGAPLARPAEGAAITAPGQLASHYAPAARLMEAQEREAEGEAALWLAFGPLGGRQGLSLSETRDLTEAAANLFAHLHTLDSQAREAGITRILHDPIPQEGLGQAIRDRLARAAAPR